MLQKIFDFYAMYFGVTAPPPEKQKLVLIVLIAFFVLLAVGLLVFAEIVAKM
jgi:hypothetical protein